MRNTVKMKNKATNNMSKKQNISLESKYNQIILDEISKYKKDNIDILSYERYIEYAYKNLIRTNKHTQIITYMQFIHDVKYDSEHISKLIYEQYVNIAVRFEDYEHIHSILTEKDKVYNNNIYKLNVLDTFYKFRDYNEHMKDIVAHYAYNKDFTKYVGSIRCILWILEYYANLLEDNTFYMYDTEKLKNSMTPVLREIYNTETDSDDTEDSRLRKLGDIIQCMDEYSDIYESVCYTVSWSFNELCKITTYVYNNNLDLYETLHALASDYRWSMYNITPAQSGLQSTSITILGDLGYDYEFDKQRTATVQQMINNIHDIPSNIFITDFNKSADILIKLLKKTVEIHASWGLEII
jgi:hypothetical protein